jgi:hypothetical protein
MSQLPFARRAGWKARPALDAVAVRLTQDQLIRQVIQGGGNMPAYGKNLSPAETTALVAFLQSLHPAGTIAGARRIAHHCARRCESRSGFTLSLDFIMNSLAQLVLQSWSAPLAVNASLCLAAFFYARGWNRLRKAANRQFPVWRLACLLRWTRHNLDRNWLTARSAWTMCRSRSTWCSTCCSQLSLLRCFCSVLRNCRFCAESRNRSPATSRVHFFVCLSRKNSAS